MLRYLIDKGVEGQRIAVQLHGATERLRTRSPKFLDELRAGGAEVVPIPGPLPWHPRHRDGDFDQMVNRYRRTAFDASQFLLGNGCGLGADARHRDGYRRPGCWQRWRTDVHAMCVGPVTARPSASRLGVPTSAPERMRLGALARHITDELPLLGRGPSGSPGARLEIQGT